LTISEIGFTIKTMGKIELSGAIKKKLKEKKISLIYLYGSYLSGYSGIKPDLDIGVLLELEVKPSLEIYTELYKLFSNFFSSYGREIDLTFLNQAPLTFQFEVVSRGKLLYEGRKGTAVNYKEKVLREYLDFKYYLNRFDKVLLESIK